MKIGVAGVLGRMGATVIDLVRDEADIEVAAVFDRPGTEGQQSPVGPLVRREEALAASEVIVDFSSAQASTQLAVEAAGRGGPALVIGSTGYSEAEASAIASAAAKIAIVRSGNFSLAVNLMAVFVEQAARRLEAGAWDIEIIEAHHRAKRDAPSGTALMLGEMAARGRGGDLVRLRERPREGVGQRSAGAIGFSVMRGGGIVGEHSVVFAGDDEILTLAHSARDRRIFARGALVAARWARGRAPGLYGMTDVLELASASSDAG
jgi:4-hydroxy-tetrahydrodipicolinate reductase